MENLLTGNIVSKNTGISNRMLRYYERIGLISSQRKEGYAYRVYDKLTILRLRQIMVLRKLRIPIKQISEIFRSNDAIRVISTFEHAIEQIDQEITALSLIKSILGQLVSELDEKANIQLQLDWLENSPVTSLIDVLSLPKNTLSEEKLMINSSQTTEDPNHTFKDLTQADKQMGRLLDKEVRIVYLPPATVASIHRIGGEPETETGNLLFDFIKKSDLATIKPDFRHYGFNSPDGNPPHNSDDHGYERWVTIPNDMEIPEGFFKKSFPGGLYAAHMIPFGAFEEWEWLYEWANNHDKYEIAWGDPECMHGLMEEHLDAFHHYLWTADDFDRSLQLDLLMPIKERPVL
ncbi:MAG: effector binding domain-containing protein [Lachnospiraceae bacterium]|nr:effector binding domain-containing protein [Lachnospiraceae bacterium]